MFRGYPLPQVSQKRLQQHFIYQRPKNYQLRLFLPEPPEEQYIPSRPVLQILKNLRHYQPDDLDNYRTVEELAEELF